MLGYLHLEIICSRKPTVFLKLYSQKTIRFLEQIMSADEYPNIFSCQMKAIVYICFSFSQELIINVGKWNIEKNMHFDCFRLFC